MSAVVGPRYMREVNSAAILSELRTRGRMTVSGLAVHVGLSRQAVTRALAALRDQGLVGFEAPEPGSPSIGRPARWVRFRAEAAYVLGIDVDPHRCRFALADLAGEIVGTRDVKVTNALDRTTLIRELDVLLETESIPRAAVWSACVAIPGVIDPTTGFIKLIASMPELHGDWLATSLREHLECPVYVDNDIKIATHGVRSREGAGGSFVFVYWGERVGAGIVIGGRLHRGASNDAGDIGFIPIMNGGLTVTSDRDGPGHFEEWVGIAEVVRLTILVAGQEQDEQLVAALTDPAGSPVEIVLDAILEGNKAANRAFDEIARRFALGLATIRAVLDPGAILIGGPMARLGVLLSTALQDHLDVELLDQPWVDVPSGTDDAILKGAIWHSLEDLFGRSEPAGSSRDSIRSGVDRRTRPGVGPLPRVTRQPPTGALSSGDETGARL